MPRARPSASTTAASSANRRSSKVPNSSGEGEVVSVRSVSAAHLGKDQPKSSTPDPQPKPIANGNAANALHPWRHPNELAYICRQDWAQDVMIEYLCQKGFTIPPHNPNTAVPFVQITGRDGTVTNLPRKYRIPLLFVAKFQWDSLRLVLTSASPATEWELYKFDIIHLSRLCQHLFTQANAAKIAGGRKGLDKQWRSPMFNRVLTRFYHHWFISQDVWIKKFWEEFDEEEYENDILKNDWSRWALKGHKGFVLTKDEIQNGITAGQFMRGLGRNSEGVWTWTPGTDFVSIPPPHPAPEDVEAITAVAPSPTTVEVKREQIERVLSGDAIPTGQTILAKAASLLQSIPDPAPSRPATEDAVVGEKRARDSDNITVSSRAKKVKRAPKNRSKSKRPSQPKSGGVLDGPPQTNGNAPRTTVGPLNWLKAISLRDDSVHDSEVVADQGLSTHQVDSDRQADLPVHIPLVPKNTSPDGLNGTVGGGEKDESASTHQSQTPVLLGSSAQNPEPNGVTDGDIIVPAPGASSCISPSPVPQTSAVAALTSTLPSNSQPAAAASENPSHLPDAPTNSNTPVLASPLSFSSTFSSDWTYKIFNPFLLRPSPPPHRAPALPPPSPPPVSSNAPSVLSGMVTLSSDAASTEAPYSLTAFTSVFEGAQEALPRLNAKNELSPAEDMHPSAGLETPSSARAPRTVDDNSEGTAPAEVVELASVAADGDNGAETQTKAEVSNSNDGKMMEGETHAGDQTSVGLAQRPLTAHDYIAERVAQILPTTPPLAPTLDGNSSFIHQSAGNALPPASATPQEPQGPTDSIVSIEQSTIPINHVSPQQAADESIISDSPSNQATQEPVVEEPPEPESLPLIAQDKMDIDEPPPRPEQSTTSSLLDPSLTSTLSKTEEKSSPPVFQLVRNLTSLLSPHRSASCASPGPEDGGETAITQPAWPLVLASQSSPCALLSEPSRSSIDQRIDALARATVSLAKDLQGFGGEELDRRINTCGSLLQQRIADLKSVEDAPSVALVGPVKKTLISKEVMTDPLPSTSLGIQTIETAGTTDLERRATSAIPEPRRQSLSPDATMVDIAFRSPMETDSHAEESKVEAPRELTNTKSATSLMTSMMRNVADLLECVSGDGAMVRSVKGKEREVDGAESGRSVIPYDSPVVSVFLAEFKSMKEELRRSQDQSREEVETITSLYRSEVESVKEEMRAREERSKTEFETLKRRHREEVESLRDAIRVIEKDQEKVAEQDEEMRVPPREVAELRRRVLSLEGQSRSQSVSRVSVGAGALTGLSFVRRTDHHPLGHLLSVDGEEDSPASTPAPPHLNGGLASASTSKPTTPTSERFAFPPRTLDRMDIDEGIPLPIKSQRKFHSFGFPRPAAS